MKLKTASLIEMLLSEGAITAEADSEEYLAELDNLIISMKSLKDSLGRGKDRLTHRKERHRLQSAIEAVRYLRRKSERNRQRMLSEGGRKIQHLPKDQKALLSPEVVTQTVTLYRELLDLFNRHLEAKGLDPVTADRPVGSTAYYQEDLADGSETIYGDIDYLVVFPPVNSESLSDARKAQAQGEKLYRDEFLNFLNASPPDFVDVELTGDVSPTMAILTLADDKKVQVDMISTVPRYQEWMNARWVPERGVKGYVGGNLYRAIGDSLVLTLGAQGVLARVKDGKRVTSRDRGKNVNFVQVSVNPRTFFKDIVLYLAGDNALISEELDKHSGVDPDNISISGIATGAREIAENLEANDALPEKFSSAKNLLEEILARFKILLENSVSKKIAPGKDGVKISNEKANSLVKMNSEQYNNVKNEFNL